LSFLVALRAEDVFGLGAAQRGLLLTGFGLFALLCGGAIGRGVDRLGAGRAALAGCFGGALVLAGVALIPSVLAMAVLWALAGIAAQWVQVALNTLSLTDIGPNAAGEVSVVQAFRNGGGAVAPPAFAPIYHLLPAAGFLLPAALLISIVPPVLSRRAHGHPVPHPVGPS
jgi:MFS family permease